MSWTILGLPAFLALIILTAALVGGEALVTTAWGLLILGFCTPYFRLRYLSPSHARLHLTLVWASMLCLPTVTLYAGSLTLTAFYLSVFVFTILSAIVATTPGRRPIDEYPWTELGMPAALVVVSCLVLGLVHNWGYAIATLVYGLLTFGFYTPYSWLRHSSPLHGRLHLATVLTAVLCLVVRGATATSAELASVSDVLFNAWVFLLAVAVISSAVAGPLYSPATSTGSLDDNTRWMADLQATVQSLRRAFGDFHRQVTQEQEKVRAASSQAHRYIESQENRLAELQRAVADAQSKARQYLDVANVPKEARAAIAELIGGRSQRDFWIGVVSGATGTILVGALRFLLDRLPALMNFLNGTR